MYEVTRNGAVVARLATVAQARDRVEYLAAEYPADRFEVYAVCGTDRVYVGL